MRYSLRAQSLMNTLRDSDFVVLHVEALGRAAEFMAWRPRGQSEEPNPKSFVLCRVFVPASGKMIMTEQGRLETKKEGEWRLYGELKTRETLLVGETEVVLYEISPELFEVL